MQAVSLVAHAGVLEALQSLSAGRKAHFLDACAGVAGAVLDVVAASLIVIRYTHLRETIFEKAMLRKLKGVCGELV
jgi:hypothetical protein